jgi:hypothetical protein
LPSTSKAVSRSLIRIQDHRRADIYLECLCEGNAGQHDGDAGHAAAVTRMKKAVALPDKLAACVTMLVAHLEAVRKLKAAADALYTALNADQKRTADEIMIGPMGMMI